MSETSSISTAEVPTCFYEPDGARYVPTRLATGPWDKRLQNGVALNGLVAYLIEQVPAPAPMVTSRIVIDIMKPTLMEPVDTCMSVLREGRRLQLFQVDLVQAGITTVRATALRVRMDDSPATPSENLTVASEGLPSLNGGRSAFRHLVETRVEAGGLDTLGPGQAWARFSGEIVPGISIAPLVQATMAADFGSGLSSIVDWRSWSFANVDISLHLTRMPRGEWVRIAATSESAGNGTAIVTTRLADIQGDFGHAHQTLFVDRRN